jgi:putative membrane protein
MDMMMWGMPGMIVLGLVFWGFLVAGVVAVAWWLLRRSRTSGRDTALDLLRERYARGDITKEEFEERRRHLAA